MYVEEDYDRLEQRTLDFRDLLWIMRILTDESMDETYANVYIVAKRTLSAIGSGNYV